MYFFPLYKIINQRVKLIGTSNNLFGTCQSSAIVVYFCRKTEVRRVVLCGRQMIFFFAEVACFMCDCFIGTFKEVVMIKSHQRGKWQLYKVCLHCYKKIKIFDNKKKMYNISFIDFIFEIINYKRNPVYRYIIN